MSPQLQLIPSVRSHIDAARQFLEARDFYSAIEHLGEAIEVCLLTGIMLCIQISLCLVAMVDPFGA